MCNFDHVLQIPKQQFFKNLQLLLTLVDGTMFQHKFIFFICPTEQTAYLKQIKMNIFRRGSSYAKN